MIDASLGCVDLDRAMATSPETARAKAKLEADFKAAQAKVDRLTADFQQWKANHPHAPDLEDKEDELEYAVNGLQGEIETEGRNLEKGVKDHLRGIVAKLQKDRKLDYVVETTMVASCPVALDLTDALVAADR